LRNVHPLILDGCIFREEEVEEENDEEEEVEEERRERNSYRKNHFLNRNTATITNITNQYNY